MSKPLIPAQRREQIQQYLAIHKIVASADLCRLLEVSEATIRRDLEWLEGMGVIERTHGGAILSQRMQIEPEYKYRAERNIKSKRAIGAAAAGMVEEGDIVFINSGTTTTEVIRHIRGDANVTVITNNLVAVLEAAEVGLDIILIGGEFQSNSNSVAGRFAIENLGQVYADKAFIGIDGISLRHGCTVPVNAEAEVITTMMERTTGPIILVADHSKWGVVSNFEVASIDQIDCLVTDVGLSAIAREDLEEKGIKVQITGSNSNDDR